MKCEEMTIDIETVVVGRVGSLGVMSAASMVVGLWLKKCSSVDGLCLDDNDECIALQITCLINSNPYKLER